MAGVKFAIVLLMFVSVDTKPVVRKMNFNLFMLKPKNSSADSEPEYIKSPVKVLFSTNGVSRFPPILEYVVQRIQGLFSVHDPSLVPVFNGETPIISTEGNYQENGANQPTDTSENEVQSHEEDQAVAFHGIDSATGLSNVVLKPSVVHPGTYEVEISVAVDDGKPSDLS